VHEKCTQLLPDGHAGAKRISGKKTDERNGQDTDDPWGPEQDFVGGFHGDGINGLKNQSEWIPEFILYLIARQILKVQGRIVNKITSKICNLYLIF
jgi:hypothetical protein